MTNQKKREEIQKYFSAYSTKKAIWRIVIGVILFSLFFNNGYLYFLAYLGLGLILYYSFNLYRYYNRVSDKQIDKWLSEDIENLKETALKKVNLLTEEIEDSATLRGFRSQNTGGAEMNIVEGKDGNKRFTPLDITNLYFTTHQLITYRCSYDFITGKPLSIATKRYFYEDIVSAETESEDTTIDINKLKVKKQQIKWKDFTSQEGWIKIITRLFVPKFFRNILAEVPWLKEYVINDRIQLNQAETFILTTKAGTSLKVIISLSELISDSLSNDSIYSERFIDNAVSMVNKFLMDKKM